MNTAYRTCKHIFDTGRLCDSAALPRHNYCAFHLHHRARLMRIAQLRARRQRLLLTLPPLENMYAVQSALNQLSEAAAAGMVDLKQARFLLSVVRAAGQFLLHADKWQATPYHCDQTSAPGSPISATDPPSVEIDLVAQYGLPPDLDLDLSPEAAFPDSVILSGGGLAAGVEGPASDLSSRAERSEVEGSAFSGHQPLTTDHSLSDLPFSGSYCGDHHSRECECCRIRPDHPVTPEAVELVEVYERLGDKAAAARSRQLERNRHRRLLRSERKRYEAVALERNLRRAVDIVAERKLAERDAQPAAEVGGPQLPDVGNCGAIDGCFVQGREAALGGESTDATSGYPAPPAVVAVAPSTPDQKRPVASADASVNLTAAAAKSSA